MKPFIKICGITNSEDALAACKFGADALGFIFYEKSPRYITPDQAAAIIQQIPRNVQAVGVFVNRPRNEIEAIIGQTGIHTAQLHGDETPDDCELKNVRVWKALRPVNEDGLSMLDRFTVDAFLLDTFDRKLYGGTGKTGNWELAHAAAKRYKVILSGGLNPDTIAGAIATVNPTGIDINSGVEAEPGKKDHRKLKELFTVLQTTIYS